MSILNKSVMLISVFCGIMLFQQCTTNGTNQANTNVENMQCNKLPQTENSIVRLSKIEVYPQDLEAYIIFAKEVGAVSMQTEPGVLTMYAMAEKANHCKITILEIYADSSAYKSHIQTDHFQKYKTGTIKMVKSLELCDQDPLNLEMKLR